METKYIIVFGLLFVFLMAGFVLAENQSRERDRKMDWSGNVSAFIASANSSVKNATYGACVVEAVNLRRSCYDSGKESYSGCLNQSKGAKDKQAVKTCLAAGKQTKNACKSAFKDAKAFCAQTTKPSFWRKMRYSMA